MPETSRRRWFATSSACGSNPTTGSGRSELRYRTEHGVDGLEGSEGAFLACSFWLADNYAFIGRMDDAEALLDRLLGLRNHLGLWAEEWEPRLLRQVGNFPQGFSHLAFVTTVRVLEGIAQGRAGKPHAVAAAG